jgi:hypothetical protein
VTESAVTRAFAVIGVIALLCLTTWGYWTYERHRAESYCNQSGRTFGPAAYDDCLDWYHEGAAS